MNVSFFNKNETILLFYFNTCVNFIYYPALNHKLLLKIVLIILGSNKYYLYLLLNSVFFFLVLNFLYFIIGEDNMTRVGLPLLLQSTDLAGDRVRRRRRRASGRNGAVRVLVLPQPSAATLQPLPPPPPPPGDARC